jgi:1,4-dihydroxy-2-naphthoate octaprenyltransferase
MKETQQPVFSILVKLSQPLALSGGALLYALGVGITHYLGQSIDWNTYWIGQVCVTMLQLSSYYLKALYDLTAPSNLIPRQENPLSNDSEPTKSLSKPVLLLVSYSSLTIGAVLTVLLIANKALNPSALMMLGIAFLVVFFYAVPPFRLVYSGYGELATSFLMANLIPAIGFLLQAGSLHRLLAMVTFPITALFLAMILAISLEKYASDLKYNRRTLLVRLGWLPGMNLHNILILIAYLLLGLAAILGLPWSLTWPGLLSFPLGLLQIWQMTQIASGAKPRWNFLVLNAIATFALTVYLLAFALWTL